MTAAALVVEVPSFLTVVVRIHVYSPCTCSGLSEDQPSDGSSVALAPVAYSTVTDWMEVLTASVAFLASSVADSALLSALSAAFHASSAFLAASSAVLAVSFWDLSSASALSRAWLMLPVSCETKADWMPVAVLIPVPRTYSVLPGSCRSISADVTTRYSSMPWKAERTRTAWPTLRCSYFLFTSARSTALTVTVVDG